MMGQKHQPDHEPENVADYRNDRQVQPEKQTERARYKREITFAPRTNTCVRKGMGDRTPKVLKLGFQAVDAGHGANFILLATCGRITLRRQP